MGYCYLRDWKGYNEALVKMGLILLDLDFVAGWSMELKVMNEGKEGARHRYPKSFIKLLAVAAERLHAGFKPTVYGLKAPDYTTI